MNMIKQLSLEDAEQFSDLIVDMYAHLENLEWFTPMPFDEETVKSMITNPRFYIVGYFEDDVLLGVSSFDYKCGKLIGKIDFPPNCNTDKIVEIGFSMVHSSYRGKGTMKKLVNFLVNKAKDNGFEWIFAKIHKDNMASLKSVLKNDFYVFADYKKPVNKEEFKNLSSQPFFSSIGKENAQKTLSKFEDEIWVDYKILIKQL